MKEASSGVSGLYAAHSVLLWGWQETWGTLRTPILSSWVPACPPKSSRRAGRAGPGLPCNHRPPSAWLGPSSITSGPQGKATHEDTKPVPALAV